MRSYLLVESRGPQENPDAAALFDLGAGLRDAGHEVTVFLVQNAVASLADHAVWDGLLGRGVQVLADEYSIAARGLQAAPRPPGVRVGGMPDLVRLLMADDVVAVWH